jgi:prepilin-type N-terminal cleavage/methylation domain-containing protein
VRSSHGFTLIEVVVALLVLSLAATALFGLLSKSIFNLGKIEDVHRYQLAGEDVMKRVLFLSKLPASGHAEGDISELSAHWIVNVAPYAPKVLDESKPAEALMKVDVEMIYPGRSGDRRLRFETVKPSVVEYNDYDFPNALETAFPR